MLEGDAAAGEALIVIADEQGKTVQYRTVARQFEDTVNWFVAYGSTEVWSIINLTEDTHPFHVHLVQFQALSRHLYNKDGFNPETGGTTSPVFFQGHGSLDAQAAAVAGGPAVATAVRPLACLALARCRSDRLRHAVPLHRHFPTSPSI